MLLRYTPEPERFPGRVSVDELEWGKHYRRYWCVSPSGKQKYHSDSIPCQPHNEIITVLERVGDDKLRFRHESGSESTMLLTDLGLAPRAAGWHLHVYMTRID